VMILVGVVLDLYASNEVIVYTFNKIKSIMPGSQTHFFIRNSTSKSKSL